MRTAEGRGRTIDEAVDAALIELGESRRNVDVKVLREGADEAVVEVTVNEPEPVAAGVPAGAAVQPAERAPSPEPEVQAERPRAGAATAIVAERAPVVPSGDEGADRARAGVQELLDRMGITADVEIRSAEPDQIQLDIVGRELGLLIGWRGETLRSLQTVTNMLLGAGPQERRVIVDVERYRQRREHTVKEIAFRAARQVKMTGDPITLDPMQPFERRSIHLALESDPDVTSVSVGQDPDRRVVVQPRQDEA